MSDVKTINELFDYLPHRYPFLLIDRVTETIAGESIKGFKTSLQMKSCLTGTSPDSPYCLGC